MNSGDKMRTMTPFKLTNEELSASIAKRFHGKMHLPKQSYIF